MRIRALIEWDDPLGQHSHEVTFEDDVGMSDTEDDTDIFFYGTPIVSDQYNFDGWRVLEIYKEDK